MKWFLDISTRDKLLLVFLLILLFMGIIMATAYTGISSVKKSYEKMSDIEFPISLELTKFRSSMNRERLLMSRMLLAKDISAGKQLDKDIEEERKDSEERLQMLLKLSHGDAQYQPLIKELADKKVAYSESWDKQISPLLRQGKSDEANSIFMGSQSENYEKVREIAIRLSNISEQRDKELRLQTEKTVKQSISIFVIIGVGAILISIVMATYLTHIISVPLKKASSIAEQISYGNLTVSLPTSERKDEIGSLMTTLGMMIESLRMVTHEIQKAVNTLTTTSKPEELSQLGKKLKKLVEQYKV